MFLEEGFMQIKALAGVAVAALSLTAAQTASASIFVLNFAGLNGNAEEPVENFYNGGFGGDGSGPGPNYGITFTSNGLACSGQPGGTCNSAEIPGGPGANLLFFLGGTDATMNVAAGFTTGFSFFYSAVNNPGFINVWSGLDETGTLLATLALPTTPNDGDPGCFGTNFCPYVPINVAFAGTAESVGFGGTINQIAFADVTLGSNTPGAPEPATWAMMLLGVAGVGATLRGARRKVSAATAA
jgi:hypothetical protein